MKILACLLVVIIMPYAQYASAQIQGPMYQINVRGLPMHCTSYNQQPVKIFVDDQLNNVGIATYEYNGSPIIVLNPNVLGQFSDTVTQWWFAHECAHHAMYPAFNNESNADCNGVKALVQYGVIRRQEQLIAFYREISSLPGSSSGHLPGPIRAQHIANCALY